VIDYRAGQDGRGEQATEGGHRQADQRRAAMVPVVCTARVMALGARRVSAEPIEEDGWICHVLANEKLVSRERVREDLAGRRSSTRRIRRQNTSRTADSQNSPMPRTRSRARPRKRAPPPYPGTRARTAPVGRITESVPGHRHSLDVHDAMAGRAADRSKLYPDQLYVDEPDARPPCSYYCGCSH